MILLCAKHQKQQQTLTLKTNKQKITLFLSENIKGLWFFIGQLCDFAA